MKNWSLQNGYVAFAPKWQRMTKASLVTVNEATELPFE
jgi:hypothetical protein